MGKKKLKNKKKKENRSPDANVFIEQLARQIGIAASGDNGKKPCKETVGAVQLLSKHFSGYNLDDLITASRSFPPTSKVDVQKALENVFEESNDAKIFGIHKNFIRDGMNFNELLAASHDPVVIGPLQYEEIEIGEEHPVRCVTRALWLGVSGENVPFALILSRGADYVDQGALRFEIAVPAGEAGFDLSQKFFKDLERLVQEAGSYKGKVISLEQEHDYSGTAGTIKVHKLKKVTKQDVILPKRTIELLNRNVIDFVKQRNELRKLKMQTKKGLLFYGPPGTGKTHTAHYLAHELPDHTTLLITAAQVGLLPMYFQLARFLQPAMVIIEDVDLIARQRSEMRNSCEESLLNYLLNEMDGLREEADVFFILTTNHPESLERALASRPGRVDQAIEFPLPDKVGRRKLITLYSRDIKISTKLRNVIVNRTENATPAFIKELLRRAAQYLISESAKFDESDTPELEEHHIDQALEEMLFAGGSLNRTLLGASSLKTRDN